MRSTRIGSWIPFPLDGKGVDSGRAARPEYDQKQIVESDRDEWSDGTPGTQLVPPVISQGGNIMMGRGAGYSVEILLVEDNAGDVRLTREALAEAKVPNRLHVTNDGIAALNFLNKVKPYAGAPDPDLILLDLNIPKKSGFEVLEQIKLDMRLRKIPVIILTSSNAESDVVRSYSNYANSYVTKPLDLEQYFKVMERIDEFWLSTARLPMRQA